MNRMKIPKKPGSQPRKQAQPPQINLQRNKPSQRRALLAPPTKAPMYFANATGVSPYAYFDDTKKEATKKPRQTRLSLPPPPLESIPFDGRKQDNDWRPEEHPAPPTSPRRNDYESGFNEQRNRGRPDPLLQQATRRKPRGVSAKAAPSPTDSGRNFDIKQIRDRAATNFGHILGGSQYGTALEKRIWNVAGSKLSREYGNKVREILYTLENNKEIKDKVMSGHISLKRLARMSTEDLASTELAKKRKAIQQEQLEQVIVKHKHFLGQRGDYIQLLGDRHDIDHEDPEFNRTVDDLDISLVPLNDGKKKQENLDEQEASPEPMTSPIMEMMNKGPMLNSPTLSHNNILTSSPVVAIAPPAFTAPAIPEMKTIKPPSISNVGVDLPTPTKENNKKNEKNETTENESEDKKSSILSPPNDLNAENLNKQNMDEDGDMEMKNMENNLNGEDKKNENENSNNNVMTESDIPPLPQLDGDSTNLDISTNESNVNDKSSESNTNDENKKIKTEGGDNATKTNSTSAPPPPMNNIGPPPTFNEESLKLDSDDEDGLNIDFDKTLDVELQEKAESEDDSDDLLAPEPDDVSEDIWAPSPQPLNSDARKSGDSKKLRSSVSVKEMPGFLRPVSVPKSKLPPRKSPIVKSEGGNARKRKRVEKKTAKQTSRTRGKKQKTQTKKNSKIRKKHAKKRQSLENLSPSPQAPSPQRKSSASKKSRKRRASDSGLSDRPNQKKKQFRPDQLEWRGRLKDTHSRKIFDINIKYVGGRKMVLKKLFPRTLHTSGRIRYANIDQVLPMLQKKSASKSHLLVKLSHSSRDKHKKKEYDKVFENYENEERGMVIDMKTKHGFKMYILPPIYDYDDCQINREMVKKIWGTDPPEGQPWGYVLYYHSKSRNKE